MAHLIDMTGMRFGKLIVVERAASNPQAQRAMWRCVCDCGNERIATRTALIKGYCKSCGCLRSVKMELQYIKNDPDWKKKKSHKRKQCPYNEGCYCHQKDCNRCGWNPKVAQARREKMGYGN